VKVARAARRMPLAPMKPSSARPVNPVKSNVPKVRAVVRAVVAIPGPVAATVRTRASWTRCPAARSSS